MNYGPSVFLGKNEYPASLSNYKNRLSKILFFAVIFKTIIAPRKNTYNVLKPTFYGNSTAGYKVEYIYNSIFTIFIQTL